MATKMKMVANFRRSLSFPNPKPSTAAPPPPPAAAKKTFHVRSTSLPCRTHPLISQLKDQISLLKTWHANSQPDSRNSAWLCDGLTRLKTVHDSLDDFLQLPQTRDSLRDRYQWIEKVLEDFLRFVDVYGIFQALILTLKHEHAAAQVAVRRRDDSKMILYTKALKKMSKELVKLIATVETVGKCSIPEPGSDNFAEELVRDVMEVTVLVSFTLFGGISSSFSVKKSTWKGLRLMPKKGRIDGGVKELEQVGVERLWGLRKNGDEEVKVLVKKMYDMEDCLCGIEFGVEKLFRSLINSRVSMLNVVTQ